MRDRQASVVVVVVDQKENGRSDDDEDLEERGRIGAAIVRTRKKWGEKRKIGEGKRKGMQRRYVDTLY